ncbi:MAG: aromatic amino acid ammonia-lyase [Alphaproteobacteria bacterium]
MNAPLVLTGETLSLSTLADAADTGGCISLSQEGLERMEAGNAAIRHAIENRIPVYGVTTGLGTRASEMLSAEQLSTFSLQTLRGRAQTLGDPIPEKVVRAAMIIRANTFLKGVSGASPAVARRLADCINAGLTPVIGDIGSIGSSDLLFGATMGLALMGEGRMTDRTGRTVDAAEALQQAGLPPICLGPRDGLALAGSGAFSAAQASLAISDSQTVLASMQSAAALSIEAFRGNLSPFRDAVVAMRPQPGDLAVQRDMQVLLRDSRLHRPGEARRLQDPLSIRHIVQVHGALHDALTTAARTVETELNCSTDNPAVEPDSGNVISTGNYHTPHITLAVDHVRRGLAMTSMLQAARVSKLMANRFTDLPMHLSGDTATSNGFAPVMKLAESVLSRIQDESVPIAFWPSLNADGIEDALTHSWESARKLANCTAHCRQLIAIELAAAAQGIDLRGIQNQLGRPAATLHKLVRNLIAPLVEDRPLGADLHKLADAVHQGHFTWRP